MKPPLFPRRTFLSILSALCFLGAVTKPVEAGSSATESDSPHENFIPPNVRTPVEEPFPGVFASYAGETVFLIRCGEKSVLVDTGYLHNTDAHLDNFEAAGVDLDTIAVIFTTHPHVDHVAGLAHARERLKCPVVAHKNAVHIIERGDRVLSAAYMPFVGWDFPFPACEVDEAIDDGDTLSVGETTFTAVHTPGHTPGCVSYLWDGKLISGDVLFANGRIGWMDAHWGSNFLDMLDTLDRIDKIAPDHLLPTHGAPFPYDSSITQEARETSKLFLDHKLSGVLGQTRRAELRDPESATRTLQY
jgi:glyoxylase-like metal-dependent hydrolase (beta-lactamase superfamily II)